MSNKKKMEVLYFVEQYIKRYGYPPTVRDIGKGLGYRSPSTHVIVSTLDGQCAEREDLIQKCMGSFFIVFCALHPISNLLKASGILPLASFFLRSSVWRKALA